MEARRPKDDRDPWKVEEEEEEEEEAKITERRVRGETGEGYIEASEATKEDE